MSRLTPDLADELLATCRAGAAEVGNILAQAFGSPTELAVGQAEPLRMAELPEDLSGPGLVVALHVGGGGALVLIPKSTGLLPPWYAEPDASGQSKLSTLAQELGMVLLPDRFMLEQFAAGHVDDLAAALARGEPNEGAMAIALEVSAGQQRGTARIIWPFAQPGRVLTKGDAKAEPDVPRQPPLSAPSPSTKRDSGNGDTARLPSYTRSLLRIQVPVVVTLAEKRQSVDRIVELSPGAIIQFEKSCEEMLDLSVANCRIACGEAVKVGDKFGLRITSLARVEERFVPVTPRKTG
jgi:flagellar motor switch protein FliN